MATTLAFFSSDIRPLYKHDVYAACCLPHNNVLQFRYLKEWLDKDIDLSLIKQSKEKGVIFFTHVHPTERPYRVLSNTSIREVTVIDFEDNIDTGLVHIYLALGDFRDISISRTNPDYDNRTPTKKYVARLNFDEGTNHNWFQRVEAIKNEFENELFIKVEIKTAVGKLGLNELKYDAPTKQSIYYLNDDTEYIIYLSLIDLSNPEGTQNQNSFSITEKSSQLDINCPDVVSIGATRDNRNYRLIPRTIDVASATSFLKFITRRNEQPNGLKDLREFSLTFKIQHSYRRIIEFGGLTTIAIIAALCIGIFADLWKEAYTDIGEAISYLIVGLVLGFISSALLFKAFNKK